MKFDDLKAALEKLDARKRLLETEFTRKKAQQDTYLKILKDKFGIEYSEIDAKMAELNSEKEVIEVQLKELLTKISEYVSGLEKALNECK